MGLTEEERKRERAIFGVTIWGGVINTVLLILKFVAGIVGHSAAMIADATHSLSDFLTDVIVLIFVKVSNKPADDEHVYGHGKYETLATALVGIALLVVAGLLAAEGIEKILMVIHGETLPMPGKIALWAALASIALKELTYQFTVRVGHQYDSPVVVANAWHHRSDAFSSIGTAIGIGGAIILGDKWTVLDPIAAVVVSIFIIVAAVKICKEALSDLLEHSLPEETIEEIKRIVAEDPEVSEMHHLRTRRLGSNCAIEMHLRMPGKTPLYEAHHHSMLIEQRLKQRFGVHTHVALHIEPTKINGKYEEPKP